MPPVAIRSRIWYFPKVWTAGCANSPTRCEPVPWTRSTMMQPDVTTAGEVPRPAVGLPSHARGVVTTAVLLGVWLAATVAAGPVSAWIAARAVQIELGFDLDANPPQAEE